MSFPPHSPAPPALLTAQLSLPPSSTQQQYQQQQQLSQFQPASSLHFSPQAPSHSSHSSSGMLPQAGQHSPLQSLQYQSGPHSQTASASAFPYPSAFLQSGSHSQSPHPHSLFSQPFVAQSQAPRMSPQPAQTTATSAAGNVSQSNHHFGFNLATPTLSHSANAAAAAGGGVTSQQSLITAQGSSYFLSNPHLTASQHSHMPHNEEAVYGRSPSPLRPVHLTGQSLSMLPQHHQQSLHHSLSLTSPSLLMHQAATSGQPMFVHSQSHSSQAAVGGGGGAQSLSLPSLAIQQYLNPQQQHQSAAAPSFFSSHPQSLPAPYSSLAPVPPSHLPSTRWHCPGGCGKVLNKRSFRSLKKHKSICVLYMGWAKKNGAASTKQIDTANTASSTTAATSTNNTASGGGVRGDGKKGDSGQRVEHREGQNSQLAAEGERQRQSLDDEGAREYEHDTDDTDRAVTGSTMVSETPATSQGERDSPNKRQRVETQTQQHGAHTPSLSSAGSVVSPLTTSAATATSSTLSSAPAGLPLTAQQAELSSASSSADELNLPDIPS